MRQGWWTRATRAVSVAATAAIVAALAVAGPASATPSAEPTPESSTSQSAGTASPTPETSATATPQPTGTSTPQPTGTATPQPSATAEPSPRPSGTAEPDPSATPEPSASAGPDAGTTADEDTDTPTEPSPTASAYASPGLWSATTPRTTFGDVSAVKGDPHFTPYAEAIGWLATLGAGLGWGLAEDDDAFRADDDATRTDLAAFLYRAAGMPYQVPPAEPPYADLEDDAPALIEIAWLAANDVDLAGGGDEFAPDAATTRGEVALALHRVAGERRIVFVPGLSFEPLKVPTEFETSTQWLESLGVADPDGDAVDAAAGDTLTRGELAQLLFEVVSEGIPLTDSPTLAERIGYTGEDVPTLVGTRNGLLPDTALCVLPWDEDHRLSCHAAADLDLLDAAFHDRFGSHITITDSYRDLTGQVVARATKGRMAARPGTSQHGWGAAIDLNASGLPGGYGGEAYAWLIENAPRFDWALPEWASPGGAKPEPWHLEHQG
ncbi:D-alanyl-D-alanine carboxypeptidase family protein [Demequina sp. NBRC 110057]|uniref:D-alanyl-D-alanine carboxypeptidase family protein n=1 Tax=Demequina sp. NBRC 110057 TaxID=1570346 RepID=UPI0011789F68|nr:D-alanyl-D-alanine carboxypeptidase family protein [Demequina sp. NBRC 110057]